MILVQKEIKVGTGSAHLSGFFLEHIQGVTVGAARPLILILPGGGYTHLSDREAEPVALQFNARGFHACVLRYSIAPAVYPQALLETAKAVSWARAHSKEYGIDPDKIIVCGFSAGGHLAACLGAFWQKKKLADLLGEPNENFRPNGLILGYPVITSGQFAHRGSFESLTGGDKNLERKLSIENQITETMPPVFDWHTYEDGTVPVENSLLLAQALRRAGVSMELHIFQRGPHGLALGNAETANAGREKEMIQPQVQTWPDLAAQWIREQFGA